MNTIKTSNPVRLIAFFLTAAILTTTFGFTVDGWGVKEDEKDSQGSLGAIKKEENFFNPPKEDNTEKNPEIIIPEHINRLTGLETTNEISSNTPLAFITEGLHNTYGISQSDLLVEIPVENEETRFVSFISDISNLWKVGAVSPSKGYINNITKYFGAIAVYNEIDENIKYDYCDLDKTSIDLSLNEGFSYTEFSNKIYTNCQLIEAAKKYYSTVKIDAYEDTLPYSFNSFGNNNIKFDSLAIRFEAKLNENSILKLTFDKENRKYSYENNGISLTDPLNGKNLSFTNCFVLFADSVTYDNFDGCQMVLNTVGSGVGYYITEGSYTEIKWSSTISGALLFCLSNGEKLTVNRGNSYICYIKSSKINNISFS